MICYRLQVSRKNPSTRSVASLVYRRAAMMHMKKVSVKYSYYEVLQAFFPMDIRRIYDTTIMGLLAIEAPLSSSN